MDTLASVVPPGLNWGASFAMVACAALVSLAELLRRRSREVAKRKVMHVLARCWMGLSGLSGVELPVRARQTLAILLNETLIRHFPTLKADWLSVERGRLRGLYKHRAVALDPGKLTRAQRRHAMASLNVLLGVLDELVGQTAETEGARLAAVAQVRGLRTRLRVDQLKHEAVYAGHLGETATSASAYQQALAVLEAESHLARASEIDALRRHVDAALGNANSKSVVGQPV